MDSVAPTNFQFVTFSDQNIAVGLAVRLLLTEPVFAGLPFASIAAVLDGQAVRGHYGFALDEAGQVRGFLGWAHATRADAERWAQGGTLSSDDCRIGECLIINVWIEKDRAIHNFVVERLRGLLAGKTMAYFRRMYRDGRMRTTRMQVDATVSSRILRRMPETK